MQAGNLGLPKEAYGDTFLVTFCQESLAHHKESGDSLGGSRGGPGAGDGGEEVGPPIFFKKNIFVVVCPPSFEEHERESISIRYSIQAKCMDASLKVENTIVDQEEVIPIIEERLGDISQIKTKYEIIIMPNKAQADGDILYPNTALIRNFIKSKDIKVCIAVKEPHKYVGLYSCDQILPTLIFIGGAVTTIGLNILSCFIYDKYFKNSTKSPNATISLEYMELNNQSTTLKRTAMKGTVSDVIKTLEALKEDDKNGNIKT